MIGRNLVVAFILSLGFVFSSPAIYAAKAPEPETAVSKEDQEALQRDVRALAEAFGVEKPKATPEKTEKEQSKKTVADVADRALSMVENVTAQLSNTLSKIAPEVWRIMIRQQYAKAAMATIVPFGLIIAVLLVVAYIRKHWQPWDRNDAGTFQNWRGEDEKWSYIWVTRIVPAIILFLSGAWLFNRMASAIAYLINPEYYAIQDLLRMLLHRAAQ